MSDARVQADAVVIEYVDARGGVQRQRRLRDVRVTHQSGRRRMLLEAAGAVLFVPLDDTARLHAAFTHEGRLTLRSGTAACVVKVSGAPPDALAKLAACLQSGSRLQPDAQPRPPARASAPAPAGVQLRAAGAQFELSLFGAAAATAAAARAAAAPAPPAHEPPPPADVAAAGADAGPVTLTAEQAGVVELVMAGRSLFFTGGAGTGKSVVLRELRRRLPAASTAFTGTTGVAACSIGGVTVHAFAGVPVASVRALEKGAVTVAEIVSAARRRRDVVQRWQATSTLIVDEISMMDAATWDLFEAVARGVRGDQRPFGGVRLCVAGDFFQLPPPSRDATFAFKAATWRACLPECIELREVHRQRDPTFVAMLNELRWGRCSDASAAALRARWRAPLSSSPASAPGIVATKLCTHRADVERENAEALATLSGAPIIFRVVDTVLAGGSGGGGGAGGGGGFAAMLDAACPAGRELTLKVGAQVILLRTLDVAAGLVNGARGVVTRFAGVASTPTVRFATGAEVDVRPVPWSVESGGRVVATRRQLPLELAWAVSIHKAQGTSLDAVDVDLSRVFEAGQAYVALSRARSLAGLSLSSYFEPATVRAHPEVVRFYTGLRDAPAAAAAAAAATGGSAAASRRPSAAGSVHSAAPAASTAAAPALSMRRPSVALSAAPPPCGPSAAAVAAAAPVAAEVRRASAASLQQTHVAAVAAAAGGGAVASGWRGGDDGAARRAALEAAAEAAAAAAAATTTSTAALPAARAAIAAVPRHAATVPVRAVWAPAGEPSWHLAAEPSAPTSPSSRVAIAPPAAAAAPAVAAAASMRRSRAAAFAASSPTKSEGGSDSGGPRSPPAKAAHVAQRSPAGGAASGGIRVAVAAASASGRRPMDARRALGGARPAVANVGAAPRRSPSAAAASAGPDGADDLVGAVVSGGGAAAAGAAPPNIIQEAESDMSAGGRRCACGVARQSEPGPPAAARSPRLGGAGPAAGSTTDDCAVALGF